MVLRTVFLSLGGAAALIHVASYVKIMAWLDRRGYKTNAFLARIYFGRYLKAYKEATVNETGKPGPLYSVCLTAILFALAFFIVAAISPR